MYEYHASILTKPNINCDYYVCAIFNMLLLYVRANCNCTKKYLQMAGMLIVLPGVRTS